MRTGVDLKSSLLADLASAEAELTKYKKSRKGSLKEYKLHIVLDPENIRVSDDILYIQVLGNSMQYWVQDSHQEENGLVSGVISQTDLPELDFTKAQEEAYLQAFLPSILSITSARGDTTLDEPIFYASGACVCIALLCCWSCMLGACVLNLFRPSSYRNSELSNKKIGLADIALQKIGDLRKDIRDKKTVTEADKNDYKDRLRSIIQTLSTNNDALHANKHEKVHTKTSFFKSNLAQVSERLLTSTTKTLQTK